MNPLLGAICGDIVGSSYEFHPTKQYHFDMMLDDMEFTDDSICTVAVAEWLLLDSNRSIDELKYAFKRWAFRYPNPKGSYGAGFNRWLKDIYARPYNSYGNGSAMRVSPVGWACNSLEETLETARISAVLTHNHVEGIKGAQATAACVFLARVGDSKDDIRTFVSSNFGYNLNRSIESIRPTYSFKPSCQETVPESIMAFLESTSYEDAIRKAISLGGDADTMGSITGAIAAAYYKEIPKLLVDFCMRKLPKDISQVLSDFELKFKDRILDES